MKKLLIPFLLLVCFGANAQLIIDNASFIIGENAIVTVIGNVQSNVSIQANGTGTAQGKLLMKGTALQQINMGSAANVIPRLEIDNTNNVQLTSNLKVENLEFTNGKLQIGDNDLVFTGAISGAGTGKFIETNGTGLVRDSIVQGAAISTTLPVGYGTAFTPITLTSSATNTGTNATVGARATGSAVATPTRHPRTEAYLNNAWVYETQNVAGAGTITGTGTYSDDATGRTLVSGTNLTASSIVGFSLVGTTWSLTGSSSGIGTVSAALSGTTGSIYGMNRFLLSAPAAFLQGANNNDGTMKDTYRTPTLIIPASDPYRSAPYSTAFAHVNNPVTETIVGTPFADQLNANNNIVDWVFVELRNVTGSTTAPVVQTRSAFITRGGNIVDVDGTSPLYFKQPDGVTGNYAIAIRHRNHLGVATNPASPKTLGLTASEINFKTSASGGLYGTANVNYVNNGTINMLYAGNVYLNSTVNYVGLNTDRAQILSVIGNPGGATSPGKTMTTPADYQIYSIGDVNFNKTVDYVGLSPDRSFIVGTVLGGNTSPSPAKTQVLPN